MIRFIKRQIKKIVIGIVAVFLAVHAIDYFDEPTPSGLPYAAQPGCHIVNTPEFQEGIHRAHYIPTSEERPDLYLEGASLQSLKEEVAEKK
jgi:hypothetical protein